MVGLRARGRRRRPSLPPTRFPHVRVPARRREGRSRPTTERRPHEISPQEGAARRSRTGGVGGAGDGFHPEASLPGSNFEIDVDANLKVDDPAPPSLDWANVTETRATDAANGTERRLLQGRREGGHPVSR